MKKTILCLMFLMFSLMLVSVDKSLLFLVGKVICFRGDNGTVYGFEVAKQDNHKIDIMLFKSFRTGKVERRDITGVAFDNFSNIKILENTEEEYLAKIEQEKQDNQKKLQEQEKYYENTNKSAKGNPFALFMGMKWGTNAAEFKAKFKYELGTYPKGFYISNFPLGALEIKLISLIFKNIGTEKDLKFKEEKYAQFIFDKVVMNIKPDQFESLLDIFTKKYGKPLKLEDSKIQNRMGAEFLQTIAYWEKDDRAIGLYRYGNKIDEGFAIFQSKNDLEQKSEEDKKANEKSADIL